MDSQRYRLRVWRSAARRSRLLAFRSRTPADGRWKIGQAQARCKPNGLALQARNAPMWPALAYCVEAAQTQLRAALVLAQLSFTKGRGLRGGSHAQATQRHARQEVAGVIGQHDPAG